MNYEREVDTSIEFEKLSSPNGSRFDGYSDSALSQFLANIDQYELLTPAEEIDLGWTIQENVDAEEGTPEYDLREAAIEKFMNGNFRMVVWVAKKKRNKGLEFIDLIQEGALGLRKAVEKFDPSKGFKFSTYATWWIRQSMQRAIHEHGMIGMKLPVKAGEDRSSIFSEKKRLAEEEGINKPTVAMLAEGTDLTEERVKLLLQINDMTSLNKVVGEDGSQTELGDILPDLKHTGLLDVTDEIATNDVYNEELKMLLAEIFMNSNHHGAKRMAQVFLSRIGFLDEPPKTLQELATELGVTRERVRQIEKSAKKLIIEDKRFKQQFIPNIIAARRAKDENNRR